MNQDELQLIRQAQAGDTAAFAALVERHGQFVYNLALRTLNNSEEAEDIAQETFLRAWQSLSRFRADSQIRTWLYRITTNLCYNRLPKLRADFEALDPTDELLPEGDTRSVETRMVSAELREDIYQAVDALPEHYRLLITLRHNEGYSYEEIAAITELPLGTVKTGLFRARRQLREALAAYEEMTNG